MGVHIVKGVLAWGHVQMLLSLSPKLSPSDVMQRIGAAEYALDVACDIVGRAAMGYSVVDVDFSSRAREG
ncbi:MAG: hypothetical protein CR993_05875 [Rhodobacterales bacterium]|nr:MAG: hypothetical protein CR993_05875 [Rhodobacterales bacterium]